MSEKTKFIDGLWKRTTHLKGRKIDITIWRTPYSWEAKAESKFGSVRCNGKSPIYAAKYALLNLRLNIPIWEKFHQQGGMYI